VRQIRVHLELLLREWHLESVYVSHAAAEVHFETIVAVRWWWTLRQGTAAQGCLYASNQFENAKRVGKVLMRIQV
jgi:hypothetical protein